jgi:hypothetical protein
METYLFLSGIILLVLGSIWKGSDYINFGIKILLIGFGIIGLLYYLLEIGYTIKK